MRKVDFLLFKYILGFFCHYKGCGSEWFFLTRLTGYQVLRKLHNVVFALKMMQR
jgi:hypothetical protein